MHAALDFAVARKVLGTVDSRSVAPTVTNTTVSLVEIAAIPPTPNDPVATAVRRCVPVTAE